GQGRQRFQRYAPDTRRARDLEGGAPATVGGKGGALLAADAREHAGRQRCRRHDRAGRARFLSSATDHRRPRRRHHRSASRPARASQRARRPLAGWGLNDGAGVTALIAAAGSGTRLGNGPKALVRLAGRTLLEHTLDAFDGLVDEVIVALPGGLLAER